MENISSPATALTPPRAGSSGATAATPVAGKGDALSREALAELPSSLSALNVAGTPSSGKELPRTPTARCAPTRAAGRGWARRAHWRLRRPRAPARRRLGP
jgi:hypothetical protein